MLLFSNIKRYIDASILCIKFPFLYPRNRFSGLHYNSDIIYNWIKKLNDKTQVTINLEFEKANSISELKDKHLFNNQFITKSNKTIIVQCFNDTIKLIYNGESFYKIDLLDYLKYKDNPIYIDVLTVYDKIAGKNKYIIKVYYINNELYTWDNHPTGFLQSRVVIVYISKYTVYIKDFLNWWEKYILLIFHCIPSYTELDAMPDGWRKGFGILMCQEIKNELKKYHYLYKYRIALIKEKNGELRWYDSGVPVGSLIFDIIQKYEELSHITCVRCGKYAKWIAYECPYCDDCILDLKYIIPNPYIKNKNEEIE